MLNSTNNSLNFQNSELLRKLQDRSVFEQVMKKPEHTTIDAPKGTLVKENLGQQFAASFADTGKDIKNLANALVNGKATDTQLGRMNDIGMKLGGGIIAAVLMGSKATTNKKLMELFGFGTFFSVMSLWPKLMIDLPTKAIHGFNPHQKYIDSNGDKKPFFLDNQYLPWDIWSKEEINKIADKMGVAKDLKDREEYTKEKMRTIALQDNTLWMLTAGFATPLLTSLGCNRIEELLKMPVASIGLKNVERQIPSLGEFAEKAVKSGTLFKAQDEEFAKILKSLNDGVIPENLSENLSKIFDISRFANSESVTSSLKRTNIDDTKDLITRLFKQESDFSSFAKALAGEAGDDAAQEVLTLLQKASKETGSSDIETVLTKARAIMQKDIGTYRKKPWANKLHGFLSELQSQKTGSTVLSDEYSNLLNIASTKSASKESLQQGAKQLEEIYSSVIKPAQAQVHIYGQKVQTLNGIAGEKYNRVARTMLRALNLTDEELKLLRNSSDSFGDTFRTLLSDKMKMIAEDDVVYDNTLRKLSIAQAQVGQTGATDAKNTTGTIIDKLTEKVSTLIKETGAKLSGKGDTLEASRLKKSLESGISDAEALGVRRNVTSVDSMVVRMKDMLKLEKGLADTEFMSKWLETAKKHGLTDDVVKSMTEEKLKDTIRELAWQSSYGNAVNKGYIESNGKLYKALIDTVLSSKDAELTDWQQAARAIFQETDYIPNPALQIKENAEGVYNNVKGQSHSIKYAVFGESPLSAIKKQVNQLYNDKRWLKVFGGATLGIVALTLISQLFFGKVRNAHLYQKNETKSQDSFESVKNGNK